ncbi:MAG: glycosyltransferase family 2 protein [Calditrichaeota bacterium]|nr:glycosyltransferase family 2 protein [Calditrichota bacterium]
MKLSVLIPAYNEEKTISSLIEKVKSINISKEIIIVDDGSTDNTRHLLAEYHNDESVRVILHEQNHGKGRAIRTAITYASGDLSIIQDADLEYDPNDYFRLIETVEHNGAAVVYGSRFLNSSNRHSYKRYYYGGRVVTLFANLLFNLKLTDEPTCYKLIKTDLLKSLSLKCEGFEFCPELTAKLAKRRHKIYEVPINYYPRTVQDGKKIKWWDGLEAIWTLIKYRFID